MPSAGIVLTTMRPCLRSRRLAGEARQVLHAEIGSLDLGIEQPRLLGRRDAFGGAGEQPQTEFGLQQLQRLADRRLRDPQDGRRLGDRAGIHDRLEDLDLPIVHGIRHNLNSYRS